MKFLNKKQKNNKGFSLVELIVVIAIMVVLVAVLAPVFTKYIESSRRSTDVQNANSVAESVLADVADGRTFSGEQTVAVDTPKAIKEAIVTKGDAVAKGKSFKFTYNPASNKCAVYVDGCTAENGDLTDEKIAKAYKDADAGTFPSTT